MALLPPLGQISQFLSGSNSLYVLYLFNPFWIIGPFGWVPSYIFYGYKGWGFGGMFLI